MSDTGYVFHCYMAADLLRLERLLEGQVKFDLKLSSNEMIGADALNHIFETVICIYTESKPGSDVQLLSGKLISEFDKVYGGNRGRIVKLIPGIRRSLDKCDGAPEEEKKIEAALERLLEFENTMIFLSESNWESDRENNRESDRENNRESDRESSCESFRDSDCENSCECIRKSDAYEGGIIPINIAKDCAYLYETLGAIRSNSGLDIEDRDRIDLFNNFIFCMLPSKLI